MSVFDHREFDDHEQVLFCHDERLGLYAIIAIHSTALGPAAGGCRMLPYATFDDALTDVLRLSKGMTYKNALAGLPLGGGKCVIVCDPSRPEKAELLRAFSRHVQALHGRYWTAIDVGVGPADADILAENCDYIFARASQYPKGFDPSSYTALGGFIGIQAAAEHVWHRQHLRGLRVAIQGLGATGHNLARQLHEAGAKLVVADIREEPVQTAVKDFDARAVPADVIHAQDVDIFAPCALGAVVNDVTLPQIRAQVVCGLANNQLGKPHHGEALRSRGIVYVPDYVVNAGGMIGASTIIFTTPSDDTSLKRILMLKDTILSVLREADAQGRATSDVADEWARRRVAEAQS
jgi:leucine dehydrogenase